MTRKITPRCWLRSIFTLLLLCATTLNSQAAQSGDFTYTSTGSAIIITAYTGAGGAVTIPSTIAGLPVTIIGASAFFNKSSLTSVTIPNSVTSIGSQAFYFCSGLTSVIIYSGVTRIESFAFCACTSLTNLTIPNSVTSIGDYSFSYCTGLLSLTIPNSVTSIELAVFEDCRGLTSVTIPNSVTSIGGGAFGGCSSLTSVTIPSSVTSISFWAFRNCSGLTSITIPSSVTSIGDAVFQYCYGLTSVYFQGNAPSVEPTAFSDTYPTLYYYAGKTGWGSTYAGLATVQVGATINSQPVNVTALQGTTASFTVTASGATGYQWQKNGVDIALATAATLTLSNVQSSDATNYQVIIYNPAGNLTSNAATLTVLPDSDGDGLSDADETSIHHTDPNKTDTDGDGLNDPDEIQVYQTNPLLKDSDSDGFDDAFEVSTGYNPALASSSPDSASSIGNAVGFRFNAGTGLSYRIEDSADLQNWNTVESPIIGQGAEVVRFYFTEGHAKRFFRARRN